MPISHYAGILKKSEGALDELKHNPVALAEFTKAHNDSEEILLLRKLISERPENEIFDNAFKEYSRGIYLVSTAHYREAYKCLRLFLELSLVCVYYSTNEIDFRLWRKNKKDTNWQSLMDKDQGVLSKFFVGIFFENLKDHAPEYHSLAALVYRECSEFVHGNVKTYHELKDEISFDESALLSWLARADTVRRVIKFAFISKFLSDCPEEILAELEHMALDNFGTLPGIQALYNGGE